MNVNKVLLIGRLTQDPQLRQTNSGQQVATLSVATNRIWTDRNGARQEAAEYHTVVVWGKQAAIANQFLKKGGTVFVEGRLQTRSWQDNKGDTRKTTEVIAERIQLGPRPMGSSRASGPAPSRPDAPQKEEVPTIEIENAGAEGGASTDLPF